LSNIYLWYL